MLKPGSWANYIPARDPRHRHACLTLYRHLLALTKQVELPPDIPLDPCLPRNPLAQQVRKAFERNRKFNSSRLVSAALRNGYKGLAVLKEAVHPLSPRHAEVVHFVRDRLRESYLSKAAQPHTPDERRRMKANAYPKRPILVRVPGPPPLPESAKFMDPAVAAMLVPKETPNMTYHYERARPPVPKEKLGGTGRRHVPTLAVANIHAPFLRYKKPQPQVLSHVLLGKSNRYRDLGVAAENIKLEDLPSAELEDEWDRMVGDGPPASQRSDLWAQRQWTLFDKGRAENVQVESFSYAAKTGLKYVAKRGLDLKSDFILRTQALTKYVGEERQLAEKEKLERKEEKKKRRLERKAAREAGDAPILQTLDLSPQDGPPP